MKLFMNYQETIQYLYNSLPVFHRIGAKAFKADLSNTIKICEHLGNPQNQFKSIHIAGTNGKGSTSHYLAAILQSAGYKTGLYTSPHLKDYTERFKINEKSIENERVVKFVKENKSFIEELEPSFFELSVGLAFQYFAEENVDIAVIEVGLGGRLDSTNIIIPELSVITNIGFDHTDILGDTLPKIAFEKAGIIKPNIPVVISERHPETEQVFKNKAKESNSEIIFSDEKLNVEFISRNFNYMLVNIFDSANRLIIRNLESQLIGNYQLNNLAGVLTAIKKLKETGFTLNDGAIRNGVKNVISLTGLKGRWQILQEKPLMICDTAHNEHGLNEVLKQISLINCKDKYFILGFVKDKNIEEILKLFPKNAKFIFCMANSLRSMPPENLIEIANKVGISGYSILNVNDAIKFVLEKANQDDFIYIGGSTYVVAEIKNL